MTKGFATIFDHWEITGEGSSITTDILFEQGYACYLRRAGIG